MLQKIGFSPVQILSSGFALIILTGSILLSLPLCSKNGSALPFIDSLFTATSATCVTGLTIYDIFSQFNFLGQFIIIVLIQIGGLGFMGIAMTFSFLLGSRIGIFQRSVLMESVGTSHIGGVVRLIRRMLLCTLFFEGIGAIIISIRFIPKLGVAQGIWYGIFHAISAFCNAGFDLMGRWQPLSSLTGFQEDWLLQITIMSLIVIGGIGFIVLSDVIEHRLRFREYGLHSKIMITFTAALILLGATAFFFIEQHHSLDQMSAGEKILNAFFASVSPRTAGFNSVNYTDMTTAGRFITMLLMFIGAGPGSTGGGIKVTTFVTLLLAIYSSAKHYRDLSIFHRRLDDDAQRKAFSNIALYTLVVLACSLCLMLDNPGLTSESCLFESLSAMGTVGLTMGITPNLSSFSKLCLIILMYSGRLGSITVAMAIVRRKIIPKISYPKENITLG
ncbi:TrkH family potassium uptake protein [Ihubacter sp. mB4P-1]|uniref:TrkH family potassium uptake protein n=1 Tax=Ihubacter sp. mB4P-1 TaxID=3242370 RepID=UPI00137AC56E